MENNWWPLISNKKSQLKTSKRMPKETSQLCNKSCYFTEIKWKRTLAKIWNASIFLFNIFKFMIERIELFSESILNALKSDNEILLTTIFDWHLFEWWWEKPNMGCSMVLKKKRTKSMKLKSSTKIIILKYYASCSPATYYYLCTLVFVSFFFPLLFFMYVLWPIKALVY